MVSEVPCMLSTAQVRSLKNGGAINIKPHMIRDEGKHLLHLAEPTIKKLMSALKRNKGMRIDLGKEGEGFSFKSLAKGAEKALKTKAGKMAVKSLIDKGTDVAKEAGLSDDLIDAVKDEVKKKGRGRPRKQGRKDREDERLAMEIHNLKKGGNIFKDISKGFKKATKSVGDFVEKDIIKPVDKAVIKPVGKAVKKGAKAIDKEFSRGSTLDKIYRSDTAKKIGKTALRQGGKFAGEAIGAYLGGPEGAMIGEELGSKLGNVGADQIGIKNKDRVKQLGRSSLREGKKLATDQLSQMIDSSGLSSEEQALAHMALEGNTDGLKQGALGYAKSKLGMGMRSNSKRMILPASDASTFSPYARVNSAQMTPYIHSSPQLAKPIIRGAGVVEDGLNDVAKLAGMFGLGMEGGSIYPAGHSVHTIGQGAISDGLNDVAKVAGMFGLGQGRKDREDERLAMEIHNLKKRGRGINPAGMGINPAGMGFNPAGYSSGGAIYNPDNDPMIDRQNRRIRATMNRMRGKGIYPAGQGFNPA